MKTDLTLALQHATWLENVRGIPCEIAAEHVVSMGDNAIAFEYRRNGACLFRKVRREMSFEGKITKRMWIEPSGAELFLFNEDCLSEPSGPDTPLVICEGEIDALSWMAAGVTHVVSVPNGAREKEGEGDIVPEQDTAFSYLWVNNKLHPGIVKFNRVILATDGDVPGRVLQRELAIRIGRNKCYTIDYPEGYKDANDVLRVYGADRLTDILADAKPLVANRLARFGQISEQQDRQRYDTGWVGMNSRLMIVPPELCVITGVPGAGKSQFALALVAQLAWCHNLPGAILQFEDNIERNRRDLRTFARAKFDARENDYRVHEWVNRMFVTVSPAEDIDESVDFDLRWLQSSIEEAATRHGCRWVLIDPWNEIEHMWAINESETAYTNNALKDLKRLARRFDLALFVVTHPSKSGGQIKSLADMTMYDVAGSAAWKNKCDHGIIIHRPVPTDRIVSVKIDKSKDFYNMGTPGTVQMEYLPASANYKVLGGNI